MNKGLKVLLTTLTLMVLMGCSNLNKLPSSSPEVPTVEKPAPISLLKNTEVILPDGPALVCQTPEGYEDSARDLAEIRRYIEDLQHYAKALEHGNK